MEILHTSVMLREVMEYLVPPASDALMIDCTVGEGGHSESFLQTYPNLRIIGLDRDRNILAKATTRLSPYKDRFITYNTWFDEFFVNYSGERPSLILFDLGISVFHYEASQRGFSFRRNEDLDMRLDNEADITVADIVNRYRQEQLADVIYHYGEERYSRRIAQAICDRRKLHAITKADELADIVWHAVPHAYRYGRLHPATKTFQALRIEVNHELERIEIAVKRAIELVRPKGRIGVISFHSLEDRPVKYLFRHYAQSNSYDNEGNIVPPAVKLITKKPLVPSETECATNPPSRSAKFRVVEKVGEAS